MSLSVSGWKNTSIIIIFDTNANPSAMLAICGWSGVAEITEKKGHKWNANSPGGYKWLPSFCSARGASWFPHRFAVSLPGCCWDIGGWFWARSRDTALPLACLCLPPCLVFITWFEYMQMLQGYSIKGNSHHHSVFPPSPSLLSFSHSFPFCLFFPTAATSAACGNQLWRTRSALSQGFI